ncbi:MAG: ATP-binding cassette domain-containing protein [Bacteroidales bacterium]|mgnify:CR=1 FL=1|jgi:putative ABC transport system ATP-binding protein|nr:ATP-binding cassette domain-containing protein [Bacteroidales bacterium]NLH23833.1 ATP-binding cassette domain-containing protein [Bacteroidales bacterium]
MLELNNIKKTFHAGTVHEVRALNGVSLTLEKGSFVCVLGSNGSGKSTLLNAIAGTFPIDEGTIRMDGTDITAWPEHRRARYMGRVFQNPLSGTAPNMTIGENISLALRRGKPRGLGPGISHGKKEEYRQMVRPLNMDLEERLDNPIGKLSGGQRQALTLLMASALQPKLLLLDEHTAALDPKTAARVTEITQMIITRDSLTTLMVTHSMHQAVHMGDRLIMMHQGRVAYDFKGEDKKRLKVNDLLALFDDLRRKDAIDPGVAALLSNNYV